MQKDFTPLTFDEYARRALKSDQRSDGGSLAFPLLGLFGETGSLLSEVKKKQRDKDSYLGYAATVVEELGDVLWYLTVVGDRAHVSLQDIARAAVAECVESDTTSAEICGFASMQAAHIPRKGEPTKAFENTLLRLGGQVGRFVESYGVECADAGQQPIFRSLVTVMTTLVQAADEAGVTLEAAAIKNIAKLSDRWPESDDYPPPFDSGADIEEMLPRTLVVDIFEREVRGQTYVYLRCNGINIGDRLTDNAMTADDYRFHDVFHFANVAVLGWSPVIRDLLRVKRKSDPKTDEAQDGARAAIIEEGITTWIFGQADKLKYFENRKRGELPFDLLKHVRQFVAGTEAESCPLWLWEEAILQGYTAFRFLRNHRRGRIRVDMTNHQLNIEHLP